MIFVDKNGPKYTQAVDFALDYAFLQAVVDEEAHPNAVIVLTWAEYRRAYNRMSRAQKSQNSNIFKWLSSFSDIDIPADLPSLQTIVRVAAGLNDDGGELKELREDWKFCVSGRPRVVDVFERCLLNGQPISCRWHFDRRGRNINPPLSLSTLSQMSVRGRCPVILSWWGTAHQGRRAYKQRFGIPRYFFRLSYTSACIIQAYACMFMIPEGSRLRKYNFFTSVASIWLIVRVDRS